MTDEVNTLEALEAEAAEALAAEEAEATATTEETEEATSAEADETAETDEGASADRAAHTSKKMVEVPVQNLAKLRQQRRESREEAERLAALNAELMQRLSLQAKTAEPDEMPTLESCGFDEAVHRTEMSKWTQKQLAGQFEAIEEKRRQAHEASQRQQAVESEVMAHYSRVSAAGLTEAEYIPAEKKLRDTFGDSAIDHMIAAIGEGSEKVIFHLGINQTELAKVEELVRKDPSGLRAMAYIGSLNSKLQSSPPQKKISQAPGADRPLASGSGQGGVSNIIKRLDRLNGSNDRTEFSKYKRELIAKGHSELLRKHGYL